MIRFILLQTLRNVSSSLSAFFVSFLCLGLALFCVTFYMERDIFLSSLIPRWAKETRALIALENNATPEQIDKVKAILKVSKWVGSFREVNKEDTWNSLLHEFPTLKELSDELDPVYLPLIFEITLTEKCLNSSSECSEFLERLKSLPSVESVFSPLPWIKKIYVWFYLFQKSTLFLAAFLFLCSMIVTMTGIKLSFQFFKKEAYLFDILGASPWFIRSPFYLQGVFVFLFGLLLAIGCIYFVCYEAEISVGKVFPSRSFFLVSMLIFGCEIALIEFTVKMLITSIRYSDDLWVQ